jgi:hypothetical protein
MSTGPAPTPQLVVVTAVRGAGFDIPEASGSAAGGVAILLDDQT